MSEKIDPLFCGLWRGDSKFPFWSGMGSNLNFRVWNLDYIQILLSTRGAVFWPFPACSSVKKRGAMLWLYLLNLWLGTLILQCGRVGTWSPIRGMGGQEWSHNEWTDSVLRSSQSHGTGFVARRTGWIKQVHLHALPPMHVLSAAKSEMQGALLRCSCLISDFPVSRTTRQNKRAFFTNHSISSSVPAMAWSLVAADRWGLQEPSIIYDFPQI